MPQFLLPILPPVRSSSQPIRRSLPVRQHLKMSAQTTILTSLIPETAAISTEMLIQRQATSTLISPPEGFTTETTVSSESISIQSETGPASSSAADSFTTETTPSTAASEVASVSRSTSTRTPTTTATSSDSTSIGQAATTILGPASPSASATQTPSSTSLSTGSIVGIVIGSIVAAILLVLCLLFVLGFRIQREKWRRHGTPTEAPELAHSSQHQAAANNPPGQHRKAELEDAEYTRRLERLQDGAKPELEGSRPWRSVWRVFSIRSGRKRRSRVAAAELGADCVATGPHELPGDDVSKHNSDAPRERVAEGVTHLDA